jgi:Transposase IS4
MGQNRFKQVHRFFSFNDENTTPAPLNALWFYRIQRISDLICSTCQTAYYPSSYIAINEAMVAY